MRNSTDITQAIELHSDTVLRVCTLYFHGRPEREDAFQETFLKYAESNTAFTDDEHRKAWLIRVAANTCKDMLKRADAKTALVDEIDEAARPQWAGGDNADQTEALVNALGQLDDKYRIVLYLKYYEGYTAAEIAGMLAVPENTVYTNMARGREKLKEMLIDGTAKRRDQRSA